MTDIHRCTEQHPWGDFGLGQSLLYFLGSTTLPVTDNDLGADLGHSDTLFHLPGAA